MSAVDAISMDHLLHSMKYGCFLIFFNILSEHVVMLSMSQTVLADGAAGVYLTVVKHHEKLSD